MKLNTLRAALVLTALTSASASAELINADWQAANDRLAVTDTLSGLTWLDLSQTDGLSINDVQQQLTTTFAGWRLASRDEVLTLLDHAFAGEPLGSTRDRLLTAQNPGNVGTFKSRFGLTMPLPSGSQGLYLSDDGTTVMGSGAYSSNMITNDVTLSGDLNYRSHAYGIYLVADVPGPLGLGAAGLGLLALAGWRRGR